MAGGFRSSNAFRRLRWWFIFCLCNRRITVMIVITIMIIIIGFPSFRDVWVRQSGKNHQCRIINRNPVLHSRLHKRSPNSQTQTHTKHKPIVAVVVVVVVVLFLSWALAHRIDSSPAKLCQKMGALHKIVISCQEKRKRSSNSFVWRWTNLEPTDLHKFTDLLTLKPQKKNFSS